MNMMSYEYGALDQEAGDSKSPCDPRNHSTCMDFTFFLFKDFGLRCLPTDLSCSHIL